MRALHRAFDFLGQHSTLFLAGGVLLGLLLPPLSALARPMLIPGLLIPGHRAGAARLGHARGLRAAPWSGDADHRRAASRLAGADVARAEGVQPAAGLG